MSRKPLHGSHLHPNTFEPTTHNPQNPKLVHASTNPQALVLAVIITYPRRNHSPSSSSLKDTCILGGAFLQQTAEVFERSVVLALPPPSAMMLSCRHYTTCTTPTIGAGKNAALTSLSCKLGYPQYLRLTVATTRHCNCKEITSKTNVNRSCNQGARGPGSCCGSVAEVEVGRCCWSMD